MKQLSFACLCLAVVLLIQSVVHADDAGPAKDVPELQVLQNYAGTWDVVASDSEFTKGESTARWILKGRFLEQSGFMTSSDGAKRIEVTTLFTFDTTQNTYRSWTFLSNGPASQAVMTWDAKSKTMKSVSRPNAEGVRSTVTADFPEPGKERWKFVFTNRESMAVGEMSGVNTLRKGDAPPSQPAAVKTGSVELKVLDRFLGTWKTEYRLPKAEWTPEEKRGSAELVYTRELAGQYIRERGTHSDQTTSTLLLTYDSNTKNYRGWWFNSQGNTNESTGRWDEKSQTFFWTDTEPNEFKSTSQHHFVECAKYDWKVLIQDKQGVAMFRMEGVSVRLKDGK